MDSISVRDLYELLEVGPNASFEEIDRSYERIRDYLSEDSLAMYSMMEPGQTQEERSWVEKAYRVLRDPDRRAEYDRWRRERPVDDYPGITVERPEFNTSTTAPTHHAPTFVDESEAPHPRSLPEPEEPPAPAQVAQEETHVPTDKSEQVPAPAEETGEPTQPREPTERERVLAELNSDTEFGGSLLKKIREASQVSLGEVAEHTKVNKRYLIALEENEFDALPAAVYVRGFVTEYARCLRLPVQQVSRSFMMLYQKYRGGSG